MSILPIPSVETTAILFRQVVGQSPLSGCSFPNWLHQRPQHDRLWAAWVGKTTVARLVWKKRKIEYTPFTMEGSSKSMVPHYADPREVTNPLLGSVHDPIYQGPPRFGGERCSRTKTWLVTEAMADHLLMKSDMDRFG